MKLSQLSSPKRLGYPDALADVLLNRKQLRGPSVAPLFPECKSSRSPRRG